MRTALCAGRFSVPAARAVNGGVSNPRFGQGVSPDPGPEGCSRPDVRVGMLAVSRCDLRAECTCVVTRERVADPSRNALYFSRYFSTFTLPEIGHHHAQDRAVLGAVKALASLDPVGCGLDGASAQLEGRTYVMAGEARPHFSRPHFCVDPARRQSYREDLVRALGCPSAVLPDAER